ncbi:MAG: hypothetical protein AMXMBFR57_16760 [Acidimicrobiia bacterium]
MPGTPSHDAFSTRTLSVDDYAALQRHAADRNVVFFTTPGDLPSLAICAQLKLPALKISSGMLTNLPVLRAAAGLGLPLILSSGGAHLWEVGRSVEEVVAAGAKELALLHCVSIYPTPLDEVRLRAMQTLAAAFPYPVGYSDHTLDSTVCVAAVALGACIIEKHVTLDRRRQGADHAIAAEPKELAELVKQIRACETALGQTGKRPAPGETRFRTAFRRRLVALDDIPAGTVLTPGLVGIMRPLVDRGLAPEFLEWALGARTTRPLRRHEPIALESITQRD